MITREQVIWAYRLLLDREPENEMVISDYIKKYQSPDQLRDVIISSEEYQSKNPAFTQSNLLKPFPPKDLLNLVAGSTNLPWFLQSGAKGRQSIDLILKKNNISLNEISTALDFGCGCGRVIRYWEKYSDTIDIYGCDYNPRLIKWCRKHIKFAKFYLNRFSPPLKYKNEYFDLVYAFSVFTHLTEKNQFLWLDEFDRILCQDGLLLFSTHGEGFLDHLGSSDKIIFNKGHLVVLDEVHEGKNTCAAFHPYDYVSKKMNHRFDMVDFIPRGALGNPGQDLYLFRKNNP